MVSEELKRHDGQERLHDLGRIRDRQKTAEVVESVSQPTL